MLDKIFQSLQHPYLLSNIIIDNQMHGDQYTIFTCNSPYYERKCVCIYVTREEISERKTKNKKDNRNSMNMEIRYGH